MTYHEELQGILDTATEQFILKKIEDAKFPLQQTNAALTTELQQTKAQLVVAQQTNVTLTTKVSTLETRITELEARIRELESQQPAPDVTAGQSIQSVLTAKAEGATIVVGPGRYAIDAPLNPKRGQYLKFLSGAVVAGSKTLVKTAWVKDGTNWYLTGALPAAYTDDGVPEFTAGRLGNVCKKREDLFQNGVPVERVAFLSDLTTGHAFFPDYANNRLYVNFDPTNTTLTLARTQFAINSSVDEVTIDGGEFREFATPSQRGAITILGNKWTIKNIVSKHNHASGLHLDTSDDTVVTDCFLVENGQIGMTHYRSHRVKVLNNIINDNNIQHYRWDDWESGGYKRTYSVDCVFSGNTVVGNRGVGVWDDIDNHRNKITNNLITDNDSDGIRWEISWTGNIEDNIVLRNGLSHHPDTDSPYAPAKDPGCYSNAGINVNAAGGQEGGLLVIRNNKVVGNRNGLFIQDRLRGNSPTWPTWVRQLRNILIEGNEVTNASSVGTGSAYNGMGALRGSSTQETAEQWLTRAGNLWNNTGVNIVQRNNTYGPNDKYMIWVPTASTPRYQAGTLANAMNQGREAGSKTAVVTA